MQDTVVLKLGGGEDGLHRGPNYGLGMAAEAYSHNPEAYLW